VHRVVTQTDAAAWRPSKGELTGMAGRFPTRNIRPRIASGSLLSARTDAIARHLTDFLKATDRFSKTIIFCVDQEHASDIYIPDLHIDTIKVKTRDFR
jgi:type I restriction enzyme R subunit